MKSKRQKNFLAFSTTNVCILNVHYPQDNFNFLPIYTCVQLHSLAIFLCMTPFPAGFSDEGPSKPRILFISFEVVKDLMLSF